MKKTNRILSVAAAVCMASTVILYPGSDLHARYSDNASLTANADTYVNAKKDLILVFEWLNDDTIVLKDWNSPIPIDVEIPSDINGRKVTQLYWTFMNCPTLTSVTIPDSITKIGDYTFKGCSNLTSITIPDSVTSIDYQAFCGSGLTSITIPDSVTTIWDSAFLDCKNLTSITIKNPDCEIYDYDEIDTFPDNAIIYGYKNSTAQEYAEKYDRTFVELSDEDDDSFKIADAVILQKWLVNGNGELADWEKYDVYKDNQLDVYDLILMRQQILDKQ